MTNEELHAQMVAAMKAKDKTRLSIIRQVMTEVKTVSYTHLTLPTILRV